MVTVIGNMAEFRFYRPDAARVDLVGDFNNWRSGVMPMLRTPDGYWVAQIRLPQGVFKFRYRADGEWFTDYAAFGIEYGPFGPDSIARVSAGEAETVPAAKPAKTQRRRRGDLRVA